MDAHEYCRAVRRIGNPVLRLDHHIVQQASRFDRIKLQRGEKKREVGVISLNQVGLCKRERRFTKTEALWLILIVGVATGCREAFADGECERKPEERSGARDEESVCLNMFHASAVNAKLRLGFKVDPAYVRVERMAVADNGDVGVSIIGSLTEKNRKQIGFRVFAVIEDDVACISSVAGITCIACVYRREDR